jgi:hypothetical protein
MKENHDYGVKGEHSSDQTQKIVHPILFLPFHNILYDEHLISSFGGNADDLCLYRG